jgi:hypothetical protein
VESCTKRFRGNAVASSPVGCDAGNGMPLSLIMTGWCRPGSAVLPDVSRTAAGRHETGNSLR